MRRKTDQQHLWAAKAVKAAKSEHDKLIAIVKRDGIRPVARHLGVRPQTVVRLCDKTLPPRLYDFAAACAALGIKIRLN